MQSNSGVLARSTQRRSCCKRKSKHKRLSKNTKNSWLAVKKAIRKDIPLVWHKVAFKRKLNCSSKWRIFWLIRPAKKLKNLRNSFVQHKMNCYKPNRSWHKVS